jgi:hypothetical protein
MKRQIPSSLSTVPANLSREELDQINARDLEIINRNADRLNAEAEAVLLYQDWPHEGQ